jgi:hypothetical protein
VLSEITEQGGGIGTLGEKTVHKILKLYCEPRREYHEVECLGSIADIMNERGIIEVQTGGLAPLIPKLRRFLPQYPVELVHPVYCEKRIKWIDADGAVASSGRKVKSKGIYSCGYELFKLAPLLKDENLTVTLLLLGVDDYRRRRSRGKSSAVDRVPTEIKGSVSLRRVEDYLVFLPEGLGDEFTAGDFETAIKSRSRYDYYCLRLLCELGLLERERRGRGYIYRRV